MLQIFDNRTFGAGRRMSVRFEPQLAHRDARRVLLEALDEDELLGQPKSSTEGHLSGSNGFIDVPKNQRPPIVLPLHKLPGV